MKRDNRGFGIYTEFKDLYGNNVVVKQSSSAQHDACWIFCNDPADKNSPAPHLSRAQARRVAAALLRFAGGAR